MIRVTFLVALIGVLAACNDDTPDASQQVSPKGVAYTLLHLPDQDDVSIHIAWPTDWAYRSDVNPAAPYVGSELILSGGAEGYPAGEVGERFADLNVVGELYISVADNVIGELTFNRNDIDEVIAIANTHLRAPTLDEKWFERTQSGLEQEMVEAKSQPIHKVFDTARWAVFGHQPLREAISLDVPDTIRRVSPSEVEEWHQETITGIPEAVIIAGEISAKEAGRALDKLLHGLPDVEASSQKPEAISDFSPKRILLHVPDSEFTFISFIGQIPASSEPGEISDYLIADALGGGEHSSLFQAIRGELRASYDFEAGISNYTRDRRFLYMSGQVEGAKLDQVAKVVRKTYLDLLREGLDGVLGNLKEPYREHFTTLPEYIVDLARSELQNALDGYEVGRSLSLNDELSQITEDEILKRLAQVYPRPDDFVVIAVSPDPSALPGACVIKTPQEALDCR